MNDVTRRDWIAYVGLFRFPEGDAATRRVLGVADVLAKADYNVVVAAGHSAECSRRSLGTAGKTLGSVDYVGLGEYRSDWERIRKAYSLAARVGTKTIAWLERQSSKPKAVILYGTYAPFLLRLQKWCRTNNVPLVCDVVEWYSGSHLPGGVFGPLHCLNECSMRWLVKQCQGVIGISKLLCDYYAGCGQHVVRVPPTLNVSEISPRFVANTSRSHCELLYAGNPGKKDCLGNALSAIESLGVEKTRFRLKILGLTEEQLRYLYPQYPSDVVDVCGRRSHSETLDAVKNADFTILLRPNERYAHAGFPTKVVESLSCGTPVICNLTSDLGDYIHDAVEGIVCVDHSVGAFVDGLRCIAGLNPEKLCYMRKAARDQAERSFDNRKYVDAMREFFGDILETRRT